MSSAAVALPRRSVAFPSSIQARSTSMNPPTRNRLTDSVVSPAISVDRGLGRDLFARGREFRTEGRDDAHRDCTRHHIAVHRAVFGGEIEQSHDAGTWIADDIAGGRCECDRERIRDRVVAVAEVPVEHLAADLGAVDDVAHRQSVDWALVCQREGGVAKPAADSLGPGIDAVGACCHNCTIIHFMDN